MKDIIKKNIFINCKPEGETEEKTLTSLIQIIW